MPARIRRRFQRGLKRKPMALIKRLRKVRALDRLAGAGAESVPPPPVVQAKKETGPLEKPVTINTHLRNMIVVPEMVGSVVGVYNGKVFNAVEIKVRMHARPPPTPPPPPPPVPSWNLLARLALVDAGVRIVPAGDDWPVPGGVFHLVQASEARASGRRRDELVALHPAQVECVRVIRCGCATSAIRRWRVRGSARARPHALARAHAMASHYLAGAGCGSCCTTHPARASSRSHVERSSADSAASSYSRVSPRGSTSKV